MTEEEIRRDEKIKIYSNLITIAELILKNPNMEGTEEYIFSNNLLLLCSDLRKYAINRTNALTASTDSAVH